MYRFYMHFLFINDVITILFIDVIMCALYKVDRVYTLSTLALYIFEMYLTLNVFFWC